MATVRMTDKLIEEITGRIRNKYALRIQKFREQVLALDLARECYDHTYSTEYIELAERLNEDPKCKWVDTTSRFGVEIRYSSPIGDKQRTFNREFLYELDAIFVVPNTTGYPSRHVLHYDDSMPLYSEAVEILRKMDAVTDECEEVVKHIIGEVLTKCQNLKQVIEAWPSVVQYLPEEVYEKHTRQPRTIKARPEKIEISDEVKTALIKTQMLTSGE